jgi:hypothetical protein
MQKKLMHLSLYGVTKYIIEYKLYWLQDNNTSL